MKTQGPGPVGIISGLPEPWGSPASLSLVPSTQRHLYMLYPPVDRIEFPNIAACGWRETSSCHAGHPCHEEALFAPIWFSGQRKSDMGGSQVRQGLFKHYLILTRMVLLHERDAFKCHISDLNVAGLCVFQLTTAVTSAFLLAKVILSKVWLSTFLCHNCLCWCLVL